MANAEPSIHVIVVEGAARQGFWRLRPVTVRLKGQIDHPCQWEQFPWDLMVDYAYMKRNTDDFASLWRSANPPSPRQHFGCCCRWQRHRLCCDLLVMADIARIGLHAHVQLPHRLLTHHLGPRAPSK
jgi:enoyl-CoA hydratase